MPAGADGDFPPPPKGSPGGVRAAARSLERAADDLDEVGRGLVAASGALQADWKGYAAARYLAASGGLHRVARAAARTFRSSAEAVSGYAGALEHAQSEIERLRNLYDDAMQREAAAAAAIGFLGAELASAPPREVGAIEARMTGLAGEQDAAAGDAAAYARRAHDVIDEFEREARRHEAVLSGERAPDGPAFGLGLGTSPGVGSGLPPGVGGSGFGVPVGGLGPYRGVIPVGDPWNSDIPGFGAYWDSQHPVEEVDDLTNVVMLGAGGVAAVGVRTLGQAARAIATGAGERLGITGGRGAAQRAGQEAFRKRYGEFDRMSTSVRDGVVAGRQAQRDAVVKKQIELQEARSTTIQKAAEVAEKLGVKLPPGTPEALGHVTRFSDQYRYYVLAKLMRAQEALEARGASAAARALERLIESGFR